MSEDIIKGRDVTLYFDGSKCIHSRNCILDRPDVFVPGVKGDWIHPDNASVSEIIRIALNCPSGAIRYTLNDNTQPEKAPLVNVIRFRENGPMAIHAETVIDGQSEGNRLTLCRCGMSGNKPLCDCSHVVSGFRATGEIPVRESCSLEKRDGLLFITPLKNGPLIIRGCHELVTGTGKTAERTGESHLCRCGCSESKPYCDGSHMLYGFIS
ncbi:TPA: iron-binding protein [Citrobacter freundii]|nr:iron-binding protein [Citrobacter freundii]